MSCATTAGASIEPWTVPSSVIWPRTAGSSAAASSTLAVKPRSRLRSATVPCASRRALAPATCAVSMVIAFGTLPSSFTCKVGDGPRSRSRIGCPSDRARVLPVTSNRSPAAVVSSFSAMSAAPLPLNPKGAPTAARSAMVSVASAARALAPQFSARAEPASASPRARRSTRSATSAPAWSTLPSTFNRTPSASSVSRRGSGDESADSVRSARRPTGRSKPCSAAASRLSVLVPTRNSAAVRFWAVKSAVTCGALTVPCSRACSVAPDHVTSGTSVAKARESATVMVAARSPGSLKPSTPDAVTLPAALRAESSATWMVPPPGLIPSVPLASTPPAMSGRMFSGSNGSGTARRLNAMVRTSRPPISAVRSTRGWPSSVEAMCPCQASSGPSPSSAIRRLLRCGRPSNRPSTPPCGSSTLAFSFRTSSSGR